MISKSGLNVVDLAWGLCAIRATKPFFNGGKKADKLFSSGARKRRERGGRLVRRGGVDFAKELTAAMHLGFVHGSELTLLEKGRAVHRSTRSGWGQVQ